MKKLLFLVSIILLLGCTQSASETEISIVSAICIDTCRAALEQGWDLSNGPCLSNDIVDDWVCDVAHNPRQAVDNDPSNQCPAYGVTANHFVEVDPECDFIKAI